MAVHTGKRLILTTVNTLETRATVERGLCHSFVIIGTFGIVNMRKQKLTTETRDILKIFLFHKILLVEQKDFYYTDSYKCKEYIKIFIQHL